MALKKCMSGIGNSWKTLVAGAILAGSNVVNGADLTGGMMYAVPTPAGRAPVIDGRLDDWDLSAAEPMWLNPELADLYSARVAIMYDRDALYLGGAVQLPERGIQNPHGPNEAFWNGDVIQIRIIADPAEPWPAGSPTLGSNRRAATVNIWNNTLTGEDWVKMQYGPKCELGDATMPEGTEVAIVPGAGEYVFEARVPWSALNVPGGRNPFAPGQRMTGIVEVLWDNDTYRIAAVYREAPGNFAWRNPQKWGQIEFSATGNLPSRHPSMEEYLNGAKPKPVGVPITIVMPEEMKLSVNILGPKGEVIRELAGAETHPQGPVTVYWDGRDQWGYPMPLGTYRWGAFLSQGLEAEYMGAVGVTGNPPYETADGTGGWGADHGNPEDVAASVNAMYFLWHVAEMSRALVKADLDGRVMWRRTPFLGGGFGPFHAVAANEKYVFLIAETNRLARLDAEHGTLQDFGPAKTIQVSQGDVIGVACNDHEVFAAAMEENRVRVYDVETGALLRELPCTAPRGLALDSVGNLYVVSAVTDGRPAILVSAHARAPFEPRVSAGLEAPWDVAVDQNGRIHVTDQGESQQVKVFTPEGRPLRAMGKRGGRPWMGAYDGSSFLVPAGIAADPRGGILVAESSLPKPISRFDADTGRLMQRWFGGTSYACSNIPDSEDPWTSYYSLGPQGFARATIPNAGGIGLPDAYWLLPKTEYAHLGSMIDTFNMPHVVHADNGRKYLVGESSGMGGSMGGIGLIEGDRILPVGRVRLENGMELWSDRNGDRQIQPDEVTQIPSIAGRTVRLSSATGSQWMNSNGDLWLCTHDNAIIKIPAAGFDPSGAIRWNPSKASFAVPAVMPPENNAWTSYREGVLGVRVDSRGDIYTCFNSRNPYATEELTRKMNEGIGHTAIWTACKFAKFAPDGSLLWMAGRKATGPAKPGEIYHFWVLAGLVNDRYIAGASEWGNIYFYTHDGFYVDWLFNVAGRGGEPGPYTFGGETFSGRVKYFPERDELWAYSCGYAYRVKGFSNGHVEGEQRLEGTVALDRIYDQSEAEKETAPLRIVPVANPVAVHANWRDVPVTEMRVDGEKLAQIQLGCDVENLYVRILVRDDTPLTNVADSLQMIFKGGDAVGLSLGPVGRRERGPGQIRLLAARIDGKDRLVAMKPSTELTADPAEYVSPVRRVEYAYVGEVPGSQIKLSAAPSGFGYEAVFSVPRRFLEVQLEPGTRLAAEFEVLRSGAGQRGIQTISRNYLFSPSTTQTTMVDDVPTEANIYPEFWGTAEVSEAGE
jgi:hypothetical protein